MYITVTQEHVDQAIKLFTPDRSTWPDWTLLTTSCPTALAIREQGGFINRLDVQVCGCDILLPDGAYYMSTRLERQVKSFDPILGKYDFKPGRYQLRKVGT